jgi:hypothetical protein
MVWRAYAPQPTVESTNCEHMHRTRHLLDRSVSTVSARSWTEGRTPCMGRSNTSLHRWSLPPDLINFHGTTQPGLPGKMSDMAYPARPRRDPLPQFAGQRGRWLPPASTLWLTQFVVKQYKRRPITARDQRTRRPLTPRGREHPPRSGCAQAPCRRSACYPDANPRAPPPAVASRR